jgi:hypothetical protein
MMSYDILKWSHMRGQAWCVLNTCTTLWDKVCQW